MSIFYEVFKSWYVYAIQDVKCVKTSEDLQEVIDYCKKRSKTQFVVKVFIPFGTTVIRLESFSDSRLRSLPNVLIQRHTL